MVSNAAGRTRPVNAGLAALSKRHRASSFELWSWLFMRVSGVALLAMLGAHLAIVHVLTPIQNVDFAFVNLRWSIPFWRWYDLIMLSLAVIHGFNGVRVVADDYVHAKRWRVLTTSVLWIGAFIILVVGAQVIVSFQAR